MRKFHIFITGIDLIIALIISASAMLALEKNLSLTIILYIFFMTLMNCRLERKIKEIEKKIGNMTTQSLE